jgi:hypothetical protein
MIVASARAALGLEQRRRVNTARIGIDDPARIGGR